MGAVDVAGVRRDTGAQRRVGEGEMGKSKSTLGKGCQCISLFRNHNCVAFTSKQLLTNESPRLNVTPPCFSLILALA